MQFLITRGILLVVATVAAHAEARRLADTASTSLPWNTFLKAYGDALEQEVCVPDVPDLDEAAQYCAKQSVAKLPAAITTFNSALDTVPKICAHSRSDLLAGRRMTVLATIELVMAACKPLQEGWWEEGKAWAPLFRDGPEPFVNRFSEEAYSLLCSEVDMPPEKVDEAAKMCAVEAASKLEATLQGFKQDSNTRAKICKKAASDPQTFENSHIIRLCSAAGDRHWTAKILDSKASFRASFSREMKNLFCSGITIAGARLPDEPKQAAAVCIEKASAEFPKLLQQFYYKKDLNKACAEGARAFEDRHFMQPCHELFDHDWAAAFITHQEAFKKPFAQLLYEQTCLEHNPTDQEEEQDEDPITVETVAKACASISAGELPEKMAQPDWKTDWHIRTSEDLCKLASTENKEGKGYEILRSLKVIRTCKLLRLDKWKTPAMGRVDDFMELYSQELFNQMCPKYREVPQEKKYTLASTPTTVEEAAKQCAKRSAVLVRPQIPNFIEQYNSVEKICGAPGVLAKAVNEDASGSMWCEEIRDLWHHGAGPWADLFSY